MPIARTAIGAGHELGPPSGTPQGFGSGFHKWFSPFFDWDTPPLFKHFLKLEVAGGVLRVRCYGVHGCATHAEQPTCEDEVSIPLDGDGAVPAVDGPTGAVAAEGSRRAAPPA